MRMKSDANVSLLKLFRDRINPSIREAVADPEYSDYLVEADGTQSAKLFFGSESYDYYCDTRQTAGKFLKGRIGMVEQHVFTSREKVRTGFLGRQESPKVEVSLTHELLPSTRASGRIFDSRFKSTLRYFNREKAIDVSQSFSHKFHNCGPHLAAGHSPLAHFIAAAYESAADKIPDSVEAAREGTNLVQSLVLTDEAVESSLDDLPL